MNLRLAVLTFFCFSIINMTLLAEAAEIFSKFHPYISIMEEYSDNLNLTPTNKKEDFLTTIQPGIKFSNMDEMAGVDMDYSIGAVFYSNNSNLDYISHNASLNTKYLTSQHINFYLKESFIRSENPREREYFTMNEDYQYVLSTKTDREIYWRNVLAPTVEYQLGSENRLGINFRNNLYQAGGEGSQDSEENYINPFFSYWLNKRNGINLDYGFTRGNFEEDPDLTGHRANARYTHRFSAESSAFVEYTYSTRTFDSPGVNYYIHESAVGIAHSVTPTLNVSAQVGYFWKNPDVGLKKDGFSYRGELRNIDQRTTLQIRFQGGYTEDYFTSDNLGFNLYHRVTSSLTHRIDEQVSVGGFASIERAKFDQPEHRDTTWEIGVRTTYIPLTWLTLTLEVTHNERQSNVSFYEFDENSGMLTVNAIY